MPPRIIPGVCFRCRQYDRTCSVVETGESGWLLCYRCFAMKMLGLEMEMDAQAMGVEACPECDYRVCRCGERTP